MKRATKILILDLILALILVGVFLFANPFSNRVRVEQEDAALEQEIIDAAEEVEDTAQQHAEEASAPPEGAGDWNMMLVNPWNPVPEDMDIELLPTLGGYRVDARMRDDLEAMIADCKAAGKSPIICSAYRERWDQQSLFDRQKSYYLGQGLGDREAAKAASREVAVPGTSEHETGLAVDIIDYSYQVLDDNQANTEAQKWLMENCQDYGFILRYPEDKQDITGIIYEPWHYRYVGRENAAKIKESGKCLEEYLGRVENDKERIEAE